VSVFGCFDAEKKVHNTHWTGRWVSAGGVLEQVVKKEFLLLLQSEP
jgi:hypothetical protein